MSIKSTKLESDKFKILHEDDTDSVNKLIELYKKDAYKARVVYMNDNGGNYIQSRIVIFFHENGKFNIVHFHKKFGISKTNRLYSSQSVQSQIIYNGKFWYRYKDRGSLKIRALNRNHLDNFHTSATKNIIRDFLFEKFSWLRFVIECNIPLPFNTIIKHKLYSFNDSLKHMYKVPLPVAKLLWEKEFVNNDRNLTWEKMIKIYKSYLINVENLKDEFIKFSIFFDCLRMAKILDKKVNCSWSIKRLEQEHNSWSKEITNIVLENEPLKELYIAGIFKQFAEFSGYKLLTTNKDLLGEGMRQQHCVGIYISAVESGRSGIYHIDGYTLELVKGRPFGNGGMVQGGDIKSITINQFRGLRNINAPDELFKEVLYKVNEFNNTLKPNDEILDNYITSTKKLNCDVIDEGLDNGFL